jgi:hypothetical protein
MRLLTLSNDQISNELEKMDRDSKALRDEALRICWYMRGGISFEDAMLLNNQDRELIAKIIKENLETTQKSGMPFF